ncbi:peptidase S8 [Candidatus Poribacteria bacterium]|nr:MAG: peptidase S8 [Candidatus Poribacteria bacterium]
MHSFIALTKKSKFDTTNSETLSVNDKQRSRTDNNKLFPKLTDEFTQKLTEALTPLGFKRVTAEITMEADASDDEQESNFIPLNYLGAYVVNSSNEQNIEEAQKLFDESDYNIIPDVQLSLPKPTHSERVYRRRKQINWTTESGVHEAHRNGITGKGVLVGVLDTGCDADHIQFRRKQINFRYVPLHYRFKKMRDVRGFDVDGHGTHVCGIIAGQSIGVAPGVDLMVASVIESETYQTSLSRISIALDWMIFEFGTEENRDKPIIINMSLGFVPELIPKKDRDLLMVGIRELISTLVEDFDVLPIVAIGNDGPGNMRAPGYFPETLSVGAIDSKHKPAPFSGGGPSPIGGKLQPDIAGYGVNIFSSIGRNRTNGSLYKEMNGTSMAAPYVTGIAALYASVNTNFRGDILRRHLLNTALSLQAPADRVGVGLARFT